MTAERVLVVILSSFLAFYLLLSVIACIVFIKTLKQIQRLIGKTGDVVEEVGSTISFVKNVAAPTVLAKGLATWLNKSIRNRRAR